MRPKLVVIFFCYIFHRVVSLREYVVCIDRQEEPLLSSLSIKQTTALVDEFLHLLIIVLGERYVEGVGDVTHSTIIQREIIHLLAISRMSHSDLDKNLPEDVSFLCLQFCSNSSVD